MKISTETSVQFYLRGKIDYWVRPVIACSVSKTMAVYGEEVDTMWRCVFDDVSHAESGMPEEWWMAQAVPHVRLAMAREELGR